MAAGDEPVIYTESAVYGENEFPYTSKTTLSFVSPIASRSYIEKRPLQDLTMGERDRQSGEFQGRGGHHFNDSSKYNTCGW